MSTSQYPTRRDPRTVILGLAVIITVTVAAYAIWVWPRGPKTKLIVYTYDSFMAWGDEPETIDSRVFGPFMEQYDVEVQIVRLQTDANDVIARLIAEAENPIADVVIGIDNILILQQPAQSVLEPYTPSNIGLVNDSLIDSLDPEHYVTPFDFGLVSLVYSESKINATTHPELANLTFNNLGTTEMASSLVTEDPHLSSPGLAFLLTEIAVYDKLLKQDWRQWWSQVHGYVDVRPGWTDAWEVWSNEPTKWFLVSYGTDPAYSYYLSNSTPDTAVAPIYNAGTDYAWMQVEGIGLVKNSPNPTLAKAFIDYCLTSSVQSYVAFNQWMFPANDEITLPAAFSYALHVDDVHILNTLLPRSEIAANLTLWLDEWDIIFSS